MAQMKRIGVILLILLGAACAPSRPDPRKKVTDETPELDATAEARVMVDRMPSDDILRWTQGVQDLHDPLKYAVCRELARRAVAAGEASTPDHPTQLKEVEAIRLLVSGEHVPPDSFLEFSVWVSAHQGREGFFTIWKFGAKAFPFVLRLRQDHHDFVAKHYGYLISECVVGSLRGKASTDEANLAFCKEALTRCPPELRPHYRAILAALGDEDSLEVFPVLLKSDQPADQIYAHVMLEGMFPKTSLYLAYEISRLIGASRPGAAGLETWRPLTKRILEWWEKKRDEMRYDETTKSWAVR